MLTNKPNNRSAALIALGGIALTAPAALAGFTDPVFTFRATSSLGTSEFTIRLADGVQVGDFYMWNLDAPIQFMDGNETIASLTTGSIMMGANPASQDAAFRAVELNFNVVAGAADTVFEIVSGELTFDPIANAIGRASAGIVITDGDNDGTTLNAINGDGTFHETYANGATFANLLSGPLSAGAGLGNNLSFDTGDVALGTDVSSIEVAYRFSLSANDQAGGNSSFVITPTPASVGLLATAGLVLTRRRR